jgi:aminoglycoside phosphotransferase (APT) family kinase protein
LDWEYSQLADPLYDVACVLAYYPQAQPCRRIIDGAGWPGGRTTVASGGDNIAV